MNGKLILAALACGVAMTGCAAGQESASTVTVAPPATTVTAVVTSLVTTLPAVSSPAPSPSPSAVPGGDVLALGSSVSALHGATATVHGFANPVDLPAEITVPGAGAVWAGVDAELCVADATGIGQSRWSITDDAGHIYSATQIGDPRITIPQYPTDAQLLAGECARGWILFTPPSDANITGVRYSPVEADGSGGVVRRWSTT